MARTGELTAVVRQQRLATSRCCHQPLVPLPLAWGFVVAAGLHVALLTLSSLGHVSSPVMSQKKDITRITLVHATPRGSNIPASINAPSVAAAENGPPNSVNLESASGTDSDTPPHVDVNALTTRPRIVGDFFIPYPPSAPSGVFKARLTIDVDELGQVERVLIPNDTLPEVLAEATIAAFQGARFTPGELNGIRVRTSIQIEVSFDSDDQFAPPD